MLELEDLEFLEGSRALLSPAWVLTGLCLSPWLDMPEEVVVLDAVWLGTLGVLGMVKLALADCAIPCDSCGVVSELVHLASADTRVTWVGFIFWLGFVALGRVLGGIFEPFWLSSLLRGFFPMSVRD